MKALKRFFSTIRSSGRTSSVRPQLVALAVGGERGDALGALLRRHHLEIGRPALAARRP